MTVREGIGTGFGRAPQPELAHDIALKAAETDATKRALATFGNPFGLALYDRDQAQVTKARSKVASRDDAGTRVARSGADQSRGSRSPFQRSTPTSSRKLCARSTVSIRSMPSMPSGRAIRRPLESSGSGLSPAIRQHVNSPRP